MHNTLVYDFSAHAQYGTSCKQFLQRIARQELQGFTAVHVLSDLAHRAMTIEAIAQFGWQAKGIAQRLSQIGLRVFPIDLPLVSAATAIQPLPARTATLIACRASLVLRQPEPVCVQWEQQWSGRANRAHGRCRAGERFAWRRGLTGRLSLLPNPPAS